MKFSSLGSLVCTKHHHHCTVNHGGGSIWFKPHFRLTLRHHPGPYVTKTSTPAFSLPLDDSEGPVSPRFPHHSHDSSLHFLLLLLSFDLGLDSWPLLINKWAIYRSCCLCLDLCSVLRGQIIKIIGEAFGQEKGSAWAWSDDVKGSHYFTAAFLSSPR